MHNNLESSRVREPTQSCDYQEKFQISMSGWQCQKKWGGKDLRFLADLRSQFITMIEQKPGQRGKSRTVRRVKGTLIQSPLCEHIPVGGTSFSGWA